MPLPTPETKWAHHAALDVLANLSDRRGIGDILSEIENDDEDTFGEIKDTLAGIILSAYAANI